MPQPTGRTQMTTPSEEYRSKLRGAVRMFSSEAEEKAMTLGKTVSSLTMDDLEAAFELVMGSDPRRCAPAGYTRKPERRYRAASTSSPAPARPALPSGRGHRTGSRTAPIADRCACPSG